MEFKVLHEEWLEQIDEALARAVQRVHDGEVAQAGVSVAFKVGHDSEGELAGTFALKAGEDRKESWVPERPGQLRLPIASETAALIERLRPDEDSGLESVTISAGGNSATLSRKKVAVPNR